MSAARRLRIWEKEGGRCYLCGEKVLAGQAWEAEHVRCWELYRDDSDENLRVAHKGGCHPEKTAADMKIIRKARRQGLEEGQQARRAKNGPRLKSANRWPPRGSVKIQSKPFSKREKP